jgi:uncharacterized phiE125 gp8 family phage protein
MNLILIEKPLNEPVTLEEAKLHLRVDGAEEDSLISALISATREFCKNFTGRSLAVQAFELVTGPFLIKYGSIKLPMPPLVEVLAFKYLNEQNEEVTLEENSGFYVVKDMEPALLCPNPETGWPEDCALRPDAVRIRFKAGYVDLPKSIRQAMLLLIGHFYENREVVNKKGEFKELPFSASALLYPFKVFRW